MAQSNKPNPETDQQNLGTEIRALIRRSTTASLGTMEAQAGGKEASPWPYCSLVLVGVDHDGSPLLMLSDLAEHTANLKANPNVSLLFDDTIGRTDRLSGARVTLQGVIERVDDPRRKTRFVAQQPSAALYADFTDFHLYRLAVSRGHLVAGFGRIHWVSADDIRFDTRESGALATAEAEIVAHMNEDHGDAVNLIAEQILGQTATDQSWVMVALDPEGADFLRAGTRARVAFDNPVHDAASCRKELVRLTKSARSLLKQ